MGVERVKHSMRVRWAPRRTPRRAAALLGGIGFALLVGIGCSSGSGESAGAQEKGSSGQGEARNVILMIGDGMGPAQRDAGQLATVGAYERLVMDQLPYAGLVGTNAADPENYVTDSAAAATSMASGVKTYNGAIGLDEGRNEVPTILEQAKEAGKATGLVTTSQVTDATPAAFGAHVEDRDQQSEIGRQFIEETGVDVILGGGEDRFLPEGEEGAYPDNPNEEENPEVSQSDQGNLVENAQGLGYEYISDAGGLEASESPQLLGLFANEEMFQQLSEDEGGEYEPAVPLPDMTQKALDTLSQDPEGFFLMVEEEAVDEMGHANNSPLLIRGVQELDRSAEIARGFAEESGDTLLIVTADHECCGLTVEGPDDPESPDESGDPNAEEESEALSVEDDAIPVADSDYEFIMDYTSPNHTGVDVPLTALGPGAGQLTGNYENTRIYEVMARSMGLASGNGASASSDDSSSPVAAVIGAATPLAFGLPLLAGLGLLVAGPTRRRRPPVE